MINSKISKGGDLSWPQLMVTFTVISSWKKSLNKFNKNTIYENEVDYEGKHILRDQTLKKSNLT